jgi:prolyl-tRNA synthetase
VKYSKLFPKTLKKAPTGAESINHQLLTRAGFIHQEMAGVYTYLPLGWRVLDNISDIVRQEMDAIGGQEVVMPVLHPAENWKKTGRYSSFDVLFKLKGAVGADLVLGPTHEEIIYPLIVEQIKSYRDLPLYIYQIQTKFRNEPRAKAGLLRGREFLMKDLYSFHVSDEDRDNYYEQVRKAYLKIFKRIGLPVVETKAGGGTFSSISQEFQTLTPNGEDTVFICEKCSHAINQELVDSKTCPECGGRLKMEKAIEVGNIFPVKRAYAEAFDVSFTDKDGQKTLVSAGCYGLGISRTMGAVVEVFHDDKGIIWPESVAPYKVHIVGLDLEIKSVAEEAEKTYKLLQAEGIEVLYDDRIGLSAGEKFADADLIGVPYRIVISKKTGDKLEVKKRDEKRTSFISLEDVIQQLKAA